jgi:Ca-activated chloride channel family protein
VLSTPNDEAGVTLPLLGPLGLTGFRNPWFFLFLLIVAAVVGLYVVVQIVRQKRVLRFANMELL